MDEDQRIGIINRAKDFFREKIVLSHITGGIERASHLSEYNINPFLYKYLANFLRGNSSPRSIAEALVYPRLLGASITTTFGMQVQTLIGVLFEGLGSAIPGIDIEFIDITDGNKKYCQLKAGPNTINHHDVETVFGHFQSTINIARTNRLPIGINDMIVGVVYGEPAELSSHYKRVNVRYPVYIGQEFWHRLTGSETFYLDLITAFGEVALEVDASSQLEEAIVALTIDIEQSLGTN